MKITPVLFKQHLGRQFKKLWWNQSKVKPLEEGVEDILIQKGIPIYTPEDVLKEKKVEEKVEIIGIQPKPIPLDRTHPNWHERVCHTLRDENVLLEGLNQAKIITNTIEVKNDLPDTNDVNKPIKGIDSKIKEIILNSHLFDAEQQKLPKMKDPLRPAWNFPRAYGITDVRRNTLIVNKFLQLIELLAESDLVRKRHIFNNLYFSYAFEKNGDLMQFMLRGDTLVTSAEPLKQIDSTDTNTLPLPNIDPIKETITLNKENIYEIRNCYPIDLSIRKCHPHTLFVYHNQTEVKNIYEEEVTETQIHGRSLLKTFTVAASYAKELYGENVKVLPKPVTLQCVQTDARLFHFGIFQLNTLDLTSSIKNVWYQTERLPLFDNCAYVSGKPTLEGYNRKVIQHLLAFYHNM